MARYSAPFLSGKTTPKRRDTTLEKPKSNGRSHYTDKHAEIIGDINIAVGLSATYAWSCQVALITIDA
jgi:hypothetical protein